MRTFPVFLVGLERRRCVVVGGGSVAAEKVRALVQGGAGRIEVISPDLAPPTRELVDGVRVTHRAKTFEPSDLDGAFLAIGAADSPEVNRRMFNAAEARGVLAQVADDPPRCAFILPSVLRRGDLTIAVSTGGASPALAVRLRQRLEDEIGAEFEEFVALAGEWRPVIMDAVSDPQRRKALWYELVDSEILSYLKQGRRDLAEQEARRLIQQAAEQSGGNRSAAEPSAGDRP